MRKALLMRMLMILAAATVVSAVAAPLTAQPAGEKPAAEAVQQKGFLDFIKAGGIVGYTILAMSVVSAGLVIDTFLHTKQDKLVPAGVVEQAEALARKGRFSEMVTLCKASDSLISRILGTGLAQGSMGLPAVRAAVQDQGVRELSRLNQRVGYMGFIGSIGPMLGLLGTVLGMVGSFNVLGSAKGAARPDELAVGISYALVTTCEGLVVAIPMMFFHNFFRDRVSKLGQECSSVCERVLRVMAISVESRPAASRPAGDTAAGA